jgi:hypothetical protein
MSSDTQEFLRTHRGTRSEALADRLVDTILNDNLGYVAVGAVSRADLWLSCLDNIRRVLELLALAIDPSSGRSSVGSISDDPAYQAARSTGRRRAEQGQPLDDVLRSFRMGGRMIWEDLLDQGQELDAHDVRAIGTALWEVVDQTSAQVAVAYHSHERSVLRADEQLRAELWEGLLGGRAQDPTFGLQAARALDLPVDALLVVVSAAGVDGVDGVDGASGVGGAGGPGGVGLEERLAPHASAWVRRTREVVGLVALRDSDPRPVHALLGQWADVERGSAVAVSSPVQGLADVDEGHRQASLARESLGGPGFAAFDDRLPEVLLLSSPEISDRLTALWVTPILDLASSESEALLDTLEAWVACGGSVTRTAETVPCHRNTVLNRLRRVAAVTGHDVLEGAPPVELLLALRARGLGARTGRGVT